MRSKLLAAAAVMVCLIPGLALGQTVVLSTYVDTDNRVDTGCAATVAGQTLSGLERRLDVQVNRAGAPSVGAITLAACTGGVFQAPQPVAAAAAVATNQGVAGSDALELRISESALSTGEALAIRVGFAAIEGGNADVLFNATGDGNGGIVLGAGGLVLDPAVIPSGGWFSGLLLMALLMALAARALHRRRHLMFFALVLASGSTFAAVAIVIDGQLADWAPSSQVASDPAGDVVPAAASPDLRAAFAERDGNTLALRIDVQDLQNLSPVFTSAAATTFTVGQAGSFSITTSAIPTVTSIVRSGAALPGNVSYTDNANGTATLAGTPAALSGGLYNFSFTASNGVLPDAVQNFVLTVNEAPNISSAGSTTFTVGTAGNFSFTADGFPDPTYALGACSPALPSSISLNATSGALTGTAQASDAGTYACTLTAANGIAPSDTQSFTLTINGAPSFTSAAATTFTVGQAGSFSITTSAIPTVASIVRGGAALPGNVSYTDNANGTATLAGTPAALSGGLYNFSFTASNGVLPDAVQNFVLTVNEAPNISSAGSTTFTVGTAGNFSFTADGFPDPTYALGACSPALPSSISLNATSGALTGTAQASDAGTYACTLTAANGIAPDDTQSFTLTISGPPSFTSAAATTFTVGQVSNFSVTTNAVPTASIVRSGDALPGSVTFVDNGDGTATLGGTPDALSGGEYDFTFTASNGVLPDAVQSFALTVNEAPQITSGSSATFIATLAGSFSFSTTGFPTPSLTLTGCSPALPSSLTFNAGNGTLSGTPIGADIGSYACTLTASNGVGTNAVQALTVTVLPDTITFAFTGAIQSYVVPAGVTRIRIDAQGAAGGSVSTTCPAAGGRGARMIGDVTVTPGDTLSIMVGGRGLSNGSDAGGGGGTFVVAPGNVPLVVAGGGGGATNNINQCGAGNRAGIDASVTTAGTASGDGNIAGGINGNGGGASGGSGGGGGGLLTNGVAGTGLANNNGKAFVNGGAGGTGNNNDFGGYGGGGAGWFTGGNGGGGGGYSGGGTSGSQPFTGGGGGGSFNAGTNQANTAGANTVDGTVTFTFLP